MSWWCGNGDKSNVVEYIKSKKANGKFTVVDVGASLNCWSAPVADCYIDIKTPTHVPDHIKFIECDITSHESWDAVHAHVATHGKFDFAICSHTLEDVCNPQLVVKHINRIANAGYVAMPSKYKELSRFENPGGMNYRGYCHHRWIYSILNNRLTAFPKLSWVELDPTLDALTSPALSSTYPELCMYWQGSLSLKVVNDDWMGPDTTACYNHLRLGLKNDSVDARYVPMAAVDTHCKRTSQRGEIRVLTFDKISQEIDRSGDWEPHLSKCITALLKAGDEVVDAGVHLGFHTLLFSRLVQPEGHVHAFEVQSLLANSVIPHNLASNNADHNVTVYHVGLSDAAGTCAFIKPDYNNTLHRHQEHCPNVGDVSIMLCSPGGESNASHMEFVHMQPLDSYKLQRVKFIKLDIQGAELAFLAGAKETIARCTPIIIIEVEGHCLDRYKVTSDMLFEQLQQLGYVPVLLDSPYPCDHLCVHESKFPEFQATYGHLMNPTGPRVINGYQNSGAKLAITF